MKIKALVPVTEMVEKEFDVDVSKKDERLLKAYEVWYDNQTDENLKNLVDAAEEAFDLDTAECYRDNPEEIDSFIWEDILDNIRWEIYQQCGDDVYDAEDVQALADGDFNFPM